MSASAVTIDDYYIDETTPTTSSNQQESTINPTSDPLAYWFKENFPTMTDAEALAAEKGFLKTFESVCNQLLDTYKHMFDCLNPEKNPDLQG